MCLRKREIRNPVSKEHETGFDKLFIKVPCGNCPECRKLKSNDWVFRSYFEFLKDDKPAFFITLTYDEEHLPVYNGKPCFDFRHIQTFFSRVRYPLGKFRYFIASEYGGLLHRPHYHLILIPETNFSLLELNNVVNEYWEYGFINQIDSLASVNGSKQKAVSYISQYVTKDMDFDVYAYEFDMPSYHRQKLQASKGYGSNCNLTYEDFKRGYIFLPLGKDGASVRFNIPRYYELRQCYDYHWDKINKKVELVKNEFGVELSIDRHNRHYKYMMLQLFSSRNMHLEEYFGEDYLFSEPWHSVVHDCFSDKENLLEFCYYRPFLTFSEHTCFDYLNMSFVDGFKSSRFVHFSRVFSLLDNYFNHFFMIKDRILTERLFVQQKKRMYYKVRNNKRLYRYLQFKNFDFSQIIV